MEIYDYKAAGKDIEAVRGNIESLIADKELEKILGQDFTGELKEWDEIVAKRCGEPFTLVILGEF